ncbi:MAG TPA: ROK family protein [Allosphingosinicella sp.]
MADANALTAGVELGGTKCVCTLADANGQILDQHSLPTTGPDETLGGIGDILDGWQQARGFRAIGIASFGPVHLDPASPNWGHIANTPKPGWRGADIAPRFRRRFQTPVAFDTDVNGAALAELRWGAGRGLGDFAYITVGTGVGAGLIANGRPVHGFAHPELGHVPVQRLPGDEWPGACPFHGACVEGLASGRALEARLAGRDIAAVAADDPLWTTVTHALAQLCHVIVCAAAPGRIAMGGGVLTRQPHLLPRIEAALVESLAGYIDLPAEPYLVAPGLGAQAGSLGAIVLALDA